MKLPPLLLMAAVALTGCPQNRSGSPGDNVPTSSALLVVDANRDGVVDSAGTSDDEGRNDFTAQRGAIVLVNLDDDDSDNKVDDADDRVNGDSDTKDLSLIVLKAQPRLGASVTGKLSVDDTSASKIHLFRVIGDPASADSYSNLDGASVSLSNADLKGGATFAIEATDVVMSAATTSWQGRIRVTLEVGEEEKDAVVLRVAPVLFQYNTANTRSVFYTDGAGADTRLLTTGMAPVCQSPIDTVGLQFLGNDWDQWTQDFFDVAHMTKPGPNGTLVDMAIAVRSAQDWRDSGATVLKNLLGPDFGNIYIRGPQDENTDGDSMNSFGNWDVIPPYEKDGTKYPLGRNIWGSGSNQAEQPNQMFQSFVRAQAIQPAITVDSSWLTVGHVDEFLSWVRAEGTQRGWVMLAASPEGSRAMLQKMHDDGYGASKLFVGKTEFNWDGTPDQRGNYPEINSTRSVDQILADADLMAESQYAQTKVDDAVDIVKEEVGLADSEIIKMPFLYGRVFGKDLGYQPGTVNLLHVNGGVAVPKPFGPSINGHDPFEQDVQSNLGGLGLNVSFVDDWDLYHIEMGEVHCGTNVVRDMPLPWWESGR